MTYLAISQMVKDPALLGRVTACVALEGERDPELWTQRNKWGIGAQPGWGEAWAYAINLAKTNIGEDPGVVTDGMILAAVQSLNDIRPRGARS